MPSYLAPKLLDVITEPARQAEERAVMDRVMVDVTPQAREAIARGDREKALAEVREYETILKQDPARDWSSPEIQSGYRDALARSLLEPPADAVPAAPASEPAPPSAEAPTAGIG